jgi:hypothetical protein
VAFGDGIDADADAGVDDPHRDGGREKGLAVVAEVGTAALPELECVR